MAFRAARCGSESRGLFGGRGEDLGRGRDLLKRGPPFSPVPCSFRLWIFPFFMALNDKKVFRQSVDKPERVYKNRKKFQIKEQREAS